MEVLPEGPLASILLLIPIREGDTVSVACRYWNRVLRDIVHGTMTSEINIRNAGTVVTIQAIAAQFRSLTSLACPAAIKRAMLACRLLAPGAQG